MTNNVLTSIYDNYKQFYIPEKKREEKRLDASKSVSKINTTSPTYFTKFDEETKSDLINIKENATELLFRLNHANGINEGFDSLLNKKVPKSSKEDLVSASFVNKEIDSENLKEHDVLVENIATKQINVGNFLASNFTQLKPGNHKFDMRVGGMVYQMQFSTDASEGNLKIHNKDDETVNYFGLNNVYQMPQNMSIRVDEKNVNSHFNKAIIDDTYELNIFRQSKSRLDSAHISIASDADSIVGGVNEITFAYNKFLDAMHTGSVNNKLIKEISEIYKENKSGIEDLGFSINENNRLEFDEVKLRQAIEEKKELKSIEKFSEDLTKKAEEIIVNPVNYIDKKIVTYKNANKQQFNNPYITNSIYSGMFLDGKY